MKLISYSLDQEKKIRVALLLGKIVVDIEDALRKYSDRLGKNDNDDFPNSMLSVLSDWSANTILLKKLEEILQNERLSYLTYNNHPFAFDLSRIQIHSPMPIPNSFRDFYAFEQHVKTARFGRNLEMIPEWYEFPVFYFSNHNSILGHDQRLNHPGNTKELDYELEIACIIGKKGKDIKLKEASGYIAGYSILNDWSARDIQRKEMRVGLGPAKGKDFATSMGPYLLTADELEKYKKGKGYDLKMTARKNGKVLSQGNWADIHFSFEEMIVRASEGVTLCPGDVLGSGTVGTGCILELRSENTDGWLKKGDVMELEIEKLGILRTEIV